MHEYDDIIDLPRPQSKRHHPMPRAARAAQFASFAALAGYGDAIKETARLTDRRPDLDEQAAAELDHRLAILSERLSCVDAVPVAVTFFAPDERKSGGAIRTVTLALSHIDPTEGLLVAKDHPPIPLADLLEVAEIGQESEG